MYIYIYIVATPTMHHGYYFVGGDEGQQWLNLGDAGDNMVTINDILELRPPLDESIN